MTTKGKKISSWADLKDAVNSYPIEKAAFIRESQLDLERRGYQLFGICPFHNDERVGNFALGGPHNGYKCFACGKAGDLIDLIIKLDGVGFKQALITAAIDLDIMSESDAESFSTGGKPTYIKVIEDMFDASDSPYTDLTEEQILWRNAVYSLLSEGDAIVNPYAERYGIEKKSRLSDKHYQQLRLERQLTDEEIEEAGFFTMNKDYPWLSVLYMRLFEEAGFPPNALNVPGFWKLKDGATISHYKRPDGTIVDFDLMGYGKQFYWFTETIDALGIPIKDDKGRIVAIQLRPDDEHYSGKYIWFSSAFTKNDKKKESGLSAGAQHDVTVPKDWNTPNVFITEGKFKSLAIAKTFRSTSISLQGVSTYRTIGEKVKRLNDNHTKEVENVIVAFDADLSFNNAVMNSVLNMVEEELDGYNTYIAIWDYLFGKGIDDLINNDNLAKNTIVRIRPSELAQIRNVLNKKYPMGNGQGKKDIEKIKAGREKEFYRWLRKLYPNVRIHPKRSL